MSFKAKPRSIKDIREKAELIRTVTEMAMDTKTEQFPILHFAEIIIPQIAEDFTFVMICAFLIGILLFVVKKKWVII